MTTFSLFFRLSIVIVVIVHYPSYVTSQKIGLSDKAFPYATELEISSSPSLLSYSDMIFPSKEEEYDPWTFDPHSIYGTPYGGYGRATKSRLASLPLRLITTAASRSSLENDMDKHKHGSDGGEEDDDDDENSEDQGEEDGTYFTMVDGEGQKFACKLYYEYELEPDSLADSMFDIALERNKITDEKSNVEDENRDEIVAVDSDVNLVDDDDDYEEEDEDELVIENINLENDDENMDERIREQQQQQSEDAPVKEEAQHEDEDKDEDKDAPAPPPKALKSNSKVVLKDDIQKVLNKLTGYCAQYHKDWWSYEWCHEKGIVQFHISLKSDMDQVSADGYATFKIENMTPLGKFSHRTIVIPDNEDNDILNSQSDQIGNDDNDDDDVVVIDDDDYYDDNIDENGAKNTKLNQSPLTVESTPEGSFIEIIDTFDGGQYCDDVGKERQVKLHLKCCQETENRPTKYQEHQRGKKGGILDDPNRLSNPNVSSDITVIFQKIEEFEVCDYTATVCTLLLCDPLEEFYQVNGKKDDFDKNDLDKATGLDHNLSSYETTNNEQRKQPQIVIQKDDSIREILDKALGLNCLSMNAGWWTYGFCHQSQIHQFHEDISLDPLTALSNVEIQVRYVLGKYDKKKSEGFPKEEEVKHMRHNNDSLGENESVPKTADPHFVQEYNHGDLCEDSEVVGSAIKGGKYGDGNIERSTTVRFFCGSQKAIIRVDEDSTCHYIIDISVPELCLQKYFEVPHLKTQVVKCLPVDAN